jgi:hypothetical protein
MKIAKREMMKDRKSASRKAEEERALKPESWGLIPLHNSQFSTRSPEIF